MIKSLRTHKKCFVLALAILLGFANFSLLTAIVTPQPNSDSTFQNATLIYKSREYTCSPEHADGDFLAADLLTSDWPVAWADISQYVTAAHKAQGFIDILLTVDMTPKVNGVDPKVYVTGDIDNYTDQDWLASADGDLYDMIDTDLDGNTNIWDSYILEWKVADPIYGTVTYNYMPNDYYISLRFAVPKEVNNYYKLFLGRTNIRPYESYISFSDFYQVDLYTPALPAGPYACPDIKVSERYRSPYDPVYQVYHTPMKSRSVIVNKSVTFDGSRSLDTSGATITKYEWDFDGDGIYDAEGISPTYTYTAVGLYTVILKVTNSNNQISISKGSIRKSESSDPLPLVVNVVAAAPENKLYQNGPNPFIPAKGDVKTTINYDLTTDNLPVSLKVYTVSGELIKTLVDEPKPAGTWSTEWDGTNESGEKVA
ncbi:MAG: PKD domain-containing protein, partial [Elusimicrobia bacterium]|nr:PKD domain-containing protein [Elusimicrobiota bacterium]